LGTTTEDTVSVVPTAAQLICPGPYNCEDIGTPAPPGSQSFDPASGTWTIDAGGADINGTSDQFRFVYQAVYGFSSLTAHIAFQTNTSVTAKAGIMMRASDDPAAPYYAVMATPATGIKVQMRAVQGGPTVKVANPSGSAPVYLMIIHSANSFEALSGPDLADLALIPGSIVTMNLPSTLLEGLAVTSHNPGVLGGATIDSVVETAQ
jgi:hypothetical protein